jgi:superfamily II DNA or RNA helicase
VLLLRTPTELRLDGFTQKRHLLEKNLQYVDKSVDYALKKLKGSRQWFIQNKTMERVRAGGDRQEAAALAELDYEARLAELKAEREKTILFEDDKGLWTYTGVSPMLRELLDTEVRRQYDLPSPKLIPWSNEPKNTPRYYQDGAAEALLAAAEQGPAGVEMGTGLGKSFILQLLLKRLGLKSVVMTPSKSIAQQIYDEMVIHFGKANVGFYGSGKKESHKLFTVGIGASLTKVEPGSEAWDNLSQAQVFIADESHQCPASTLSKVCFGLCAAAPYRFFFSGTQLRADGKELLLDGITGPIVYKMSVQEGVDQGFLAKPTFRMCWTTSQQYCRSGDPNELTRKHVYYNSDLNRKVAEIVNKAVSVMGRPTLILVEELPQIAQLVPYLRYDVRFAHGGVTKDTKDLVPEQFHKSDPKKLVAGFNAGEFPILVGTSCISTGTDVKANQVTVYLRGGMSEVEVRQGPIGRSTRLNPGKTDCIVFDFGISNVEALTRHATARREIYQATFPSYSEIKI